MPKIHFINGVVQDIPEESFMGFMKRFNSAAMKYWIDKRTGNIVPLTSPTIAFIEREMPEIEETVVEREPTEREDVETVETKDEDTRTPEEIALEIMKAKSECGMNKHEGQKQIIYRQAFTAAKGGKEYFKYYPVCDFCGEKGRFIAANKLPDDVKEAALDHIEE